MPLGPATLYIESGNAQAWVVRSVVITLPPFSYDTNKAEEQVECFIRRLTNIACELLTKPCFPSHLFIGPRIF